MRIYGLTGGIASGKSTVARMFQELGAKVVDADALAREVVTKGRPALREIVAHFGPQVLTPDGELDRKALGALVFADPEARQALNRITHPRIARAGQDAMAELASAGETLAIYEAALIVENGLHRAMQGLIVVAVPEETQVARLQARDGLGPEEARSRLAAQLPLEQKLAAADFVIDNSGSEGETRAQVEAIWSALHDDARDTD